MKGIFHSTLFWTAIFLNVLGVIVGTYFYASQLAATPLPLILFVPDCPLYVFLSLLIIFRVVRNDVFSFIVSIGMVKYGLWTVFALFFHSSHYFVPNMFAISVIFVIGHIGMAVEGLAILPQKRLGTLALALAVGWFLINDAPDYFLGTVPSLPPGGLEIVRNITIASSIVLPLLLFSLKEKIRALPVVRQLGGLLLG